MTLTTEQLKAEMIEKIAVASGLRARDGRNVVAEAIYAEVVEPLLANREAQPVLYASEETLAYAKEGEKSLVTWSEPMGDAVIPLYTAPPAPAVPEDYFGRLVEKARVSADKAMRKFPQPNYVLNKVAEESGEVIKAVIHYTEGREEWANVEGEIIDNLAMLIRLVVEGDQIIGFTPPDACRAAMLAATPPISASDFVNGYCDRAGITIDEFYESQVPMPDSTSPRGWAAVSNKPMTIKAHVELYATPQPIAPEGGN
ncbi:nucleoside triphosphate pyrophosphohydrolase family protein [Serratia marcescens]|uniref:hypothetical protein n=1 Tax=Serratia marcescens TaxID=615 RepID=UPI003989CD54